MTIDADLRARLPAMVDRAYLAHVTRLVPGAKLLGVRVPALRTLARELGRKHSLDDDEAIALMHRLAKKKSPVREELLVGVFLIAQRKKRIASVTWEDLDAWVKAIDNWEVCDQLSMGVARYRLDDAGAIDRLVTWAKSPNLWRRRFAVATVATAELSKRDVERVLAPVASDREPMVKKAVAWARRELADRT